VEEKCSVLTIGSEVEMTLFEFIVKNQSMLEKLDFDSDESENISIDASEFDFSHPDLDLEIEENLFIFSVKIGNYKVSTMVAEDNLQENLANIKKIVDSGIREELVLAIEEDMLSGIQDQYENAEATLSTAQAEFDEVVKMQKSVKGSLGEIKTEWGIK